MPTHLNAGQRMQPRLGLQQGQVAAKLHVVFDPAAQRPVFFDITPARLSDITAARNLLPIAAGATCVFDLGYDDFAWRARIVEAGGTFVTRLKSSTLLRRTGSRAVAPGSNVPSDEPGHRPERLAASRRNPFTHRGRVITIQIDSGKILRLFTNDLSSPAEEIAALYKECRQIELFFKWIKQTLDITRFMGTGENAIRIQIAVALIACLLAHLMQAAQPGPHPAVVVLLIARTRLFVRRPVAELLDPQCRSAPKPGAPSDQLALPP